MEDIEVGEWIRNKEGYIGKVEKINYDKQESQNYYICEKHNIMASSYKDKIINHSKNIIDLIEVGDYYNGIQVVHKLKNGKIQLSNGYLLSNEDIKKGDNLVTKEQFNSVKYVIQEEN